MKQTKIIALLLAIMTLFSMGALANSIYVPIELQVQLQNTVMLTNNQGSPAQINEGGSVSQHVVACANIRGVTVLSPSYGNSIGTITLSVFEWEGSVSGSTSGKPLVKKTYTNYADNTFLNLQIPDNVKTKDILIHLDGGSGGVGVWVPPNYELPGTIESQETFINGSSAPGCMLSGVSLEEENKKTYPVRNPYEFITPGEPDVIKDFGVQVSDDHYTEENIPYPMLNHNNLAPAYAGYYNCDFGDTPPKSMFFRIYIMQAFNWNELQVHIDSPSGPLVASMRFVHDEDYGMDWGNNHFWTTMTCKTLMDVTGKHDVYLVDRENNGPSYIIGYFNFSHDDLPDSHWEIERKNFVPVSDDTLMDTGSDTWVATDAIGRKLPDFETVGARRENRDAILFYWTFTSLSGYKGTANMNVQKVIDAYNGPESDIKNNYDYKGWTGQPFWNESIYGYYTSYDKWVMRKQLELFSAAGVDALATDCSNGASTFATGYIRLVRLIHKMKQDGYKAPGITFILPWSANPNTTYDLENLYLGMYGAGLYSDAWYYYKGKPLIMSFDDGDLISSTGVDEVDQLHKEIAEFFTFRAPQSAYKTGQTRENMWPWLEVYPQHGFCPTEDGRYECVAVGTCQNSNDEARSYSSMNAKGVYGRSYTFKDRFTKLTDSSSQYGYNFQEQWDRALELDPDCVFITGWNEWSVGRSKMDDQGVTNAMVDEYNDEYSRDIEPSKGDLRDNYFMQMCSNIRKFKGVNPTPTASAPKSIDIGGSFSQWSDVGPEYIGFKGGVEPRNETGFTHKYENYTGRNDIVLSKAARDDANVYFYTKTAQALSPSTDSNWMRLYINTDRSYKTGWEGYDFIVNRVSPEGGKAVVEKYVGTDGSWKWEKVSAANMNVSGSELMLGISKADLGIDGAVDLEFKWHDNGVNDGDWMDFYVNGDSAPVGRFNYRYVEDLNNCVKTADEPVDFDNEPLFIARKFVMMELGNPVAYNCGHRTKIDPANDAIVPQIVNDKTLVPIRFIAESLGATVGWQESSQSATVDYMGTHIVIKEDSDKMQVDGKVKTLQTPAQTINDRMYVPLRDVSEGIGLECFWEDPGFIMIGTRASATLLTHPGLTPRLQGLFN